MQIEFTNPELNELKDAFNQLDPEEAIFMNHYELARHTGISADKWKMFLTDSKVTTFLQKEMELYKEFQLRQMIKNATNNDKSVGAAQMMNSLLKAMQENTNKEGPHLIYSYVPLTEPQKQSGIEHVELSDDVIAGMVDSWEDE